MKFFKRFSFLLLLLYKEEGISYHPKIIFNSENLFYDFTTQVNNWIDMAEQGQLERLFEHFLLK